MNTARLGQLAITSKEALKPLPYVALGATITIIVGFTVWATINFDVLWKAMRFPEAVRQMQVEVQIKK